MFDNFVSLGWYCGVAASMARYGLRSWAGPFDWCRSDFAAVLKTIGNGFTDFFIKENLLVDPDNKRWFRDTKYNFQMPHDVEGNFEAEYPSIKEKYSRRVKRFQTETKKRTCFIRCIRDKEEIEYIQNNEEYIDRVIKKSNPQNEIIYIYFNKWKEALNDLRVKNKGGGILGS